VEEEHGAARFRDGQPPGVQRFSVFGAQEEVFVRQAMRGGRGCVLPSGVREVKQAVLREPDDTDERRVAEDEKERHFPPHRVQ
jgi:hypothetical protein